MGENEKKETDDCFINKRLELLHNLGAQNFYDELHSFTNKLPQEKSNSDMKIMLEEVNSELILEREDKIDNTSDPFQLTIQQLDNLLALETLQEILNQIEPENARISITKIQKSVVELVDHQLLRKFELQDIQIQQLKRRSYSWRKENSDSIN
jgi:hypothetical protein